MHDTTNLPETSLAKAWLDIPAHAFATAAAIQAGNPPRITIENDFLVTNADGWQQDPITDVLTVGGPHGPLAPVFLKTVSTSGKNQILVNAIHGGKNLDRAWKEIILLFINEFGGTTSEGSPETEKTSEGRLDTKDRNPQEAMYARIYDLRSSPVYFRREDENGGLIVVGDHVINDNDQGAHKGERGILISLSNGGQVAYPSGGTHGVYQIENLIVIP